MALPSSNVDGMLAYTNDPVVADENLFSTDPPLDPNPNPISGFIFEGDSGSSFFTSAELFGLPSDASPFDIYVNEGGTWVFEAMSAANLPYTFSEFGGVDEFEVLFNDPQLTNIFDNLIVDVTFDSDGEFDGTLTPLLATEQVPEPDSIALLISGCIGLVVFLRPRQSRSEGGSRSREVACKTGRRGLPRASATADGW